MLTPEISKAISPERRSTAWIVSFAISVGMFFVFAYQAAYSWEFVSVAQGNSIRRAPRSEHVDKTIADQDSVEGLRGK